MLSYHLGVYKGMGMWGRLKIFPHRITFSPQSNQPPNDIPHPAPPSPSPQVSLHPKVNPDTGIVLHQVNKGT